MPELPASVRVALWASAAFNGRAELNTVATKALPDLDDISGLTSALQLWCDVGERVVLLALPRPGHLGGMPTGPIEMTAAAQDSQEMVFVPGLGGALVPQIDEYGPEGDQGWRATWTAYPSDPMPQHVVAAMSVADVELRLRTSLAELTAHLEMTPGSPMAGAAAEVFARRRVGTATAWGMPSGMPPRCARVIELAGSVMTLSDIGRQTGMQSVDSSSTQSREMVLRRLHDEAASALSVATNVAAMHYAGWV
ncbi:MAG: hypothetical protein WA962_07040 [Ornithinimicrobium sp.]